MRRAIILKHSFVKGLATPPADYLAQCRKRWGEDEWKKFAMAEQAQIAKQVQRLRESGLWKDMDRTERDFMEADSTKVTEQAIIDAAWLAEPVVCLLWALGYVSELSPYDHQVDPELTNKLPKEPTQVLVTTAKLRPTDSIRRQRDLAELWHWRSRTRQLLESGRMPSLPSGGMTIDTVIQMASVKAAEDGAFPAPIGDDFPAFGKAYRELTPEEFSIATSIARERHRAFNWLCGRAPGNRWADTPTDT
jgi:uncharacterized protein DUF4272